MSVSSQAELMDGMSCFGRSAAELMSQAGELQYKLKDPVQRYTMTAARTVLEKHSMMLLTASKAYVRHPELAKAKANRDYVLRHVFNCEAFNTISDVAQGKVTTSISTFEGTGEIGEALNNFIVQIIINTLMYEEHKYRPSLEERLESIISGATLMADSSCTRDERRERIVAECSVSAVRQALQVDSTVNVLPANPPGAVDEREFTNASQLVYGGMREIRRVVPLNSGEEEIDCNTEWDDTDDQSEISSQGPKVQSREEAG